MAFITKCSQVYLSFPWHVKEYHSTKLHELHNEFLFAFKSYHFKPEFSRQTLCRRPGFFYTVNNAQLLSFYSKIFAVELLSIYSLRLKPTFFSDLLSFNSNFDCCDNAPDSWQHNKGLESEPVDRSILPILWRAIIPRVKTLFVSLYFTDIYWPFICAWSMSNG